MRFRVLPLAIMLVAVGCQFDPYGTADRPDSRTPDPLPDAAPPAPPDASPPDAEPPPSPDAAVAHCPLDYQTSALTRTSYRFVDTPILWAAAEAACEAEGTHLVVITSDEERDVVVALLGTSPEDTSDKVWLGLTDRTSEGTWRFVTGAVATEEQLAWNSGEPNATGDCAALYRENELVPSRGGHYDDADCVTLGINRGYVCECDGEAADPDAY
jgi:hypothetical protein